MNLDVVILNLSRIAIGSKGDQNKLWWLLSDRLEITRNVLLYRVERCREAIPTNTPILYTYGAFGKHLSRTGFVNELFKNRRATVSLDYIGLYEVVSAFFGGEWEANSEVKAFTPDTTKESKANAGTWGDEYGYHFGIYSTPSESLADRLCRLNTERFDIIEGVTDKEYYTNSFRYDVHKNPTSFERLGSKKDYPKHCSGGFIHYCEYPML